MRASCRRDRRGSRYRLSVIRYRVIRYPVGRDEMGDFRSLKVWETAHRLTLAVYQATRAFPPPSGSGSPVSSAGLRHPIPANLAEGSRPEQPGASSRASAGSPSAPQTSWTTTSFWPAISGIWTADDHARLADQVDHVRRMLAQLIDSLHPSD